MRKIIHFICILSGFLFWSADGARAQFVKGADIGWLQQMEATNFVFYDSLGNPADCMQILKDHGINTVRLRVWVNPSNDRINGHCSKKEVASMALRAKNMGMRVLIDFHYSDSWADPAKQNKPADWASHSFSQLLSDLYNHTYEVLDTLKRIGAKPEWMQVGNEIPGGMLWPDGSSSNFDQLAQLLNKGYDAAKAVDSSIRVIIHLDEGNNNSKFRWFFDNCASRNVRYDIIGMSYYPYWLGTDYTATINALGANMNDMVSRYNKDVFVVEVGGDYTKVQNTYDMLLAVIDRTAAVPGHRGLGLVYWEPEGAKVWSGYQLSCWNDDGKPTAALDAFKVHMTGINEIPSGEELRIWPNPSLDGCFNIDLQKVNGHPQLKIFNANGQLVKEMTLRGNSLACVELGLVPGTYLVSLQTADSGLSGKIQVN